MLRNGQRNLNVLYNQGKPFQAITDMGPVIFLNSSHADAMRNDPRFSLDASVRKMFLTEYPGLEPIVPKHGFENRVFLDTIRKNLTHSLGRVPPGLPILTGEAADSWTKGPLLPMLPKRRRYGYSRSWAR